MELTPEQKRQLAMIDSMPYTVECDVSSEDWLTKTPEEKERLLGKSHMLNIECPNGRLLIK